MIHSDCCACRYADFATRVDARPMPVSLDTKPAQDHSQPFVFDCAGQGTTGGEQLRLRGQVGLGDRQTCFDRLVGLFDGLAGAARAIGGCGEATDTLYVDCVSTPSATTHHIVYPCWCGGASGRADQCGLVFQPPCSFS